MLFILTYNFFQALLCLLEPDQRCPGRVLHIMNHHIKKHLTVLKLLLEKPRISFIP